MSNVLELSKILNYEGYYANTDILDISLPYFNGIVLLDLEELTNIRKIYYGDEIDLQFWSLVGLTMGSSYEPVTIYTLQEGYKYILIPEEAKFTIYDDSNNIVFENRQVHSINDLSIDFTIHKSHQFEIHLAPSKKNRAFYKVAKWKKYLHNAWRKEYNCGVQNVYEPDRVRPYLPNDSDNPSWEIKHLAYIDDIEYNIFDETADGVLDTPGNGVDGNPMAFRYVPIDAMGIRILNDFNYAKLACVNNFYIEAWFKLVAKEVGLPSYGIKQTFTLILPMLSRNMYPAIWSLILPESIINNRPLYEPWLIWKVYEMLVTGYTSDETDEFSIPVFDLSPMWS